MKTEDKYFFCYSTNLYEYIRYEKGLKYICTAFHDKTMKRFYLFERTEELKLALSEYKEIGKEYRLK